MQVAVIGGGAAGFFAAICVAQNFPHARITLCEQTSKTLTKVKISGGGRCNLTNAASSNAELLAGYPRGRKILQTAFYQFNNHDVISWFSKHGVITKVEADGRVFPVSDSSHTIIDCLIKLAKKYAINILHQHKVIGVESRGSKLHLSINNKLHTPCQLAFDKVIVTCGGLSKLAHFDWLAKLGHIIMPPVPSLFSFNIAESSLIALQGISLVNAQVAVVGNKKLISNGGLLISHWGLTGPAILKLSSMGARELYEKQYGFLLSVNWLGNTTYADAVELTQAAILKRPGQQVKNINCLQLPQKLWIYVLARIGIKEQTLARELSKKAFNKLINCLVNDVYQVIGKTTFKEEFVTCGGISLASIKHKTLESRAVKNLYFAGEILDVDGITGGYNFQAAWSSAYVAAKLG